DALARRMLLEAATFGAEPLAAQGFLAAVVADGALDAHAWAGAERIVALAPQAARLNKRTLRACRQPGNGDGMQAAPDPYAYAAGAEHREGIAAFLEKRAPRF
ncbi:enoyl-CoA hydratase/isomerase family protein, partial [Myxococcus llanfairpwllgwyngyllgogerychwyrndrobwllllantysiliogogogochensis]